MSQCIPIAPFTKPVVCLASGPSLTLEQIRHVGIARARGLCHVIAVNDTIYPAYFAEIGYACDRKWWVKHQGLPNFRGLKLALEKTPFPDIVTLTNTGVNGFDDRPGCIRSGANSGNQAVQVAAKCGAKHIILVGYDYTNDGARSHWFGLHEPEMDRHSNIGNWLKHFRGVTDVLAGMNVRVVNASTKSTIDWLRRSDLRKELPI